MSMNKWAIQRVFDINLFDLSTGQCYTTLNELKNTTFSQEATIVYAQGEINNTL